ncbi:MAG: UPF0179 family protein [Halobacteriaceae archaeon]
MSTVTLIGPRLAEAGTEFVFDGEAPGCEGCPFREQCLNLTEGVRYRVTDVREGGQELDCAVHAEGSVVAVEVERAGARANVPSRGAYAGSHVDMAGPCPHTECPSHGLCEPGGIDPDGEYRIEEVEGEPPHETCFLGRELTTVSLAPPESEQ